MGIAREDARRCIGCNRCKDSCTFLTKYNINIGQAINSDDLAYSCFLCGKCYEVCPIDINGRALFLEMRQERRKIKYLPVTLEKANYIFKNYKQSSRRVLFPGCNFLGYYPRTTEILSDFLNIIFDIGTVYDCCTKPVYEMGTIKDRNKPVIKLIKRLEKNHIDELILLCPNCYWFFKEKFAEMGSKIKIKTIYRELEDLGFKLKLKGQRSFFVPCPERGRREILSDIKCFLEDEPVILQGAQCCGAGGGASLNEAELAEGMAKYHKGEVFNTYCATCSGNFNKADVEGNHILIEILRGIIEKYCIENTDFLNSINENYAIDSEMEDSKMRDNKSRIRIEDFYKDCVDYIKLTYESPDTKKAFINRGKKKL